MLACASQTHIRTLVFHIDLDAHVDQNQQSALPGPDL